LKSTDVGYQPFEFLLKNKYCTNTMAVCGKSRALLRLSIFLLFKRLQINPSIYPLTAAFSKWPESGP